VVGSDDRGDIGHGFRGSDRAGQFTAAGEPEDQKHPSGDEAGSEGFDANGL